ncbi:hypothetical protein [Streptomyces nigrescens]|uniref:Glyoxalase n=1 Tax=Streptomyces nigrescens TaxID=1920 RepID=A0ABY7ITN0_STRNI|nr:MULTISPECIES: hypothetical protein [Streptomyces]MCX5450760.1 hypothetical protein [Streptomyces libani]WAU02154.1 hypothetical protein STRNI_000122 [Streptomyces nigrescens]
MTIVAFVCIAELRDEGLRCRVEPARSWGFEAVEVRGPGGRRYLEVEAGLG